MATLSELGFQRDWTYEAIISCFNGDMLHAAPFGVKSPDMESIQVEIYNSSNTLGYIMDKGCFIINIVSDPQYFFDSLYSKGQIQFKTARLIDAPVLADTPAFIEVKVTGCTEKPQSHLINAEIINIEAATIPELYNRAKCLVMESLIVATRMNHLPEGKAEEILKENYRVIKKVAPGSTCVEMMEKLLKGCTAFYGNG
ncbi:MAG: DUF447 family protein [Deltaproteobacteria bacterium]|nr:DUF447 family protein [Deltaproteobacteria bacterium]